MVEGDTEGDTGHEVGGLNGAVSVTDIGKVHLFPVITELEIDWCLPSVVNVLL
jgi:hypothetical protein